jgi:ribulose-phosphate 3-epimerase
MTGQLQLVGALRRWSDELGRDLHIEVDGGIKPDTARLAAEAGADLMVVGSYIYRSDDYEQAIATLRRHIA